jgi:outer membrane protein OmpA-like peptidoglycan-associated protein
MGVNLDAVSIADLDRLADWLNANSDIRIRIVGHTDSRGSQRVNDLFSLARASRIQAYLLTKGIPLDRMDAVGAGSTQPVSSNATEEGRRLNRRIELIRIP